MLGAVLGGLASGAASSMLGGSGSGGGYNMPEESELAKRLKERINSNLNKDTPKFEGDLTTEQSDLEKQLRDTVSSQMKGKNIGMSQDEKDAMWNKAKDKLGEQKDKVMDKEMKSANRRGLSSSSIAQESRARTNEDYLDGLSKAQQNIMMQDRQATRQGKQNALSQAYNLSGLSQNRQQSNLQRQLGNFYKQQQLKQQPLNQGMQYLSSYRVPREQMAAGMEKASTQAAAQRDAGLMGGIGSVAGGFFGSEAGSNWLSGMLGG